MPRYLVFDNGKLANERGYPQLIGKGWRFAWFYSFSGAVKYTKKWLGVYHPNQLDQLEENKPIDYSGYGDFIEIRRIK